jgi:hypothetical protein
MRVVELCFHERDGRAAEMAARGLEAAGLCVLRRPVNGGRVPASSKAARWRVLLHSEAFAALPDAHAAFAENHFEGTVAVPLGARWPRRASRRWLIAPPAGRLHAGAFWKAVAWAAGQRVAERDRRIAAQRALFARLSALSPDAPAPRRRRGWRDLFAADGLRPVRTVRDWEPAVTPLAVAGTLALTALVAAVAIDFITRDGAWIAAAQASIAGDAAPSD